MKTPPEPTTTPQKLGSWARQARPAAAQQVLAGLMDDHHLMSEPVLELDRASAHLLSRTLVRSFSSSSEELAVLVLKHPILLAPMANNTLVGASLLPRLSVRALQVLEGFPESARQAFQPSLWPAAAIEEMVDVLKRVHKQQVGLSSDLTARVAELISRDLFFDVSSSMSWQPHVSDHLPALVACKLLDQLVGRLSFSSEELWKMLEAIESQVSTSDRRYQEVLFHDSATPRLWAQALRKHDCKQGLVTTMTERGDFLADRACRSLALGKANWIGHGRLLRATPREEELNKHIRVLSAAQPRHVLYVFDQAWSGFDARVRSASLGPLLSHPDPVVRRQAFRYVRRIEAQQS